MCTRIHVQVLILTHCRCVCARVKWNRIPYWHVVLPSFPWKAGDSSARSQKDVCVLINLKSPIKEFQVVLFFNENWESSGCPKLLQFFCDLLQVFQLCLMLGFTLPKCSLRYFDAQEVIVAGPLTFGFEIGRAR